MGKQAALELPDESGIDLPFLLDNLTSITAHIELLSRVEIGKNNIAAPALIYDVVKVMYSPNIQQETSYCVIPNSSIKHSIAIICLTLINDDEAANFLGKFEK